jgi:hypothetical protein
VRDGLADRALVLAAHVDRDRSDQLPAGPELVEERPQDGAVATLGDPHDVACVVVGDDGQVAMAPAIAHLVNTEHAQAVQAPWIETFGGHALDDPPDGVPGDPHQPRDRVLGHLLRQISDHVLEVAREATARPRPRDRLDPHTAVAALNAPHPRGEEAALAAEVEMPPAREHRVMRRRADLPAARADPSPAPQRDRNDHPVKVEPDRLHRGAGKAEQPVECRGDAHAVLLEEPLSFRHPAASPNGRRRVTERARKS